MIVTGVRAPSRIVDGTAWRCLARRGMLHSECETFDYLRLAPGAGYDGREGVEGMWFVLSGEGHFTDGTGRSIPLRAGDLLLWAGGTAGRLHSGPRSELGLLAFAVLPAAVTGRLPARSPVAAEPARQAGSGHG